MKIKAMTILGARPGRVEYTIEKVSVLTGKKNRMTFEADHRDFDAWEKYDVLVQDAMPYLAESVREFLVSGMSIEEQDEFFGKLEREAESDDECFDFCSNCNMHPDHCICEPPEDHDGDDLIAALIDIARSMGATEDELFGGRGEEDVRK